MALTKDDLQAIGTLLEPIKDRLDSVEAQQDRMEARQDRMEESLEVVKKSQFNVETVMFPKLMAAVAGITAGIEKNEDQDTRILEVEEKVENHGLRIAALEYAGRAK